MDQRHRQFNNGGGSYSTVVISQSTLCKQLSARSQSHAKRAESSNSGTRRETACFLGAEESSTTTGSGATRAGELAPSAEPVRPASQPSGTNSKCGNASSSTVFRIHHGTRARQI